MTPEDARRRISAIRADKAHPFFEESHPEHGRAVRDMEALYADAYPEPTVENTFDRPPPMKDPLPADPGIKHREPSVFWEQSAPIPREELEAAQEEARLRRERAKAIGRALGEAHVQSAEADILKVRGTAGNVAAIAQGLSNLVGNLADQDRREARDFDVAQRLFRMSPEEKQAYVARIAASLEKQGRPVPEDLADNLFGFDPDKPDVLKPGYLLNSAGHADFYGDRRKNIAAESDGPSVLEGLNNETRDQQETLREFERNKSMQNPGAPARLRSPR
jgi:hypothetical protein